MLKPLLLSTKEYINDTTQGGTKPVCLHMRQREYFVSEKWFSDERDATELYLRSFSEPGIKLNKFGITSSWETCCSA